MQSSCIHDNVLIIHNRLQLYTVYEMILLILYIIYQRHWYTIMDSRLHTLLNVESPCLNFTKVYLNFFRSGWVIKSLSIQLIQASETNMRCDFSAKICCQYLARWNCPNYPCWAWEKSNALYVSNLSHDRICQLEMFLICATLFQISKDQDSLKNTCNIVVTICLFKYSPRPRCDRRGASYMHETECWRTKLHERFY